jgi:hypothetical protein
MASEFIVVALGRQISPTQAALAPGDTPAPSITPIANVIADFTHPRHWRSALIGRQNRWSGGPGQPREHHIAGSFLGDFRTPSGVQNSS